MACRLSFGLNALQSQQSGQALLAVHRWGQGHQSEPGSLNQFPAWKYQTSEAFSRKASSMPW